MNHQCDVDKKNFKMGLGLDWANTWDGMLYFSCPRGKSRTLTVQVKRKNKGELELCVHISCE